LLDIEMVMLSDGKARFYLWLPYHHYDEFERLTKEQRIYVEELVRTALKEHNNH